MDYYIRSWDPDSTYPPNPQEGDVAYTITLDQSWAPVAGVKNDNLLKEEVYENGEWKEVGGGGSTLTTLFSGSVTTEDDGYSNCGTGTLDVTFPYVEDDRGGCPATITVTLDGVNYAEVPYDPDTDGSYGATYGESSYDYSVYPFNIYFGSEDAIYNYLTIYTETAGAHELVVKADVAQTQLFDTCSVQFINNHSSSAFFCVAYNTALGTKGAYYIPGNSSDDDPIEVILSGGHAEAYFIPAEQSQVASCSGAIESIDTNYFTIAGDGTITVRDSL